MMHKYDVVYILKEDPPSEELRYSLRSVEKNLPHRRVWFFCGKPDGIAPDVWYRKKQRGVMKWEKARSSILDVCAEKGVSDKFWLMNDDFFILKPVKSEKNYFGGMLRDKILTIEAKHQGLTGYSKMLRRCQQELNDADFTAFDYALHIPMLVEKKKMFEALQRFPDCPMFRSLYGNYAMIGGSRHEDVKIYGNKKTFDQFADFVSTTSDSFLNGEVGKQIRAMFPEKSRFETNGERVREEVLQLETMARLP